MGFHAIDGSWHEVECTGPGLGYGACIAWTSVWFPRKIPRNFLSRPFLFGFSAAEAVESLKSARGVANYSHLIEANYFEQCGCRENVNTFRVPGEEAEDPYEELTEVAAKRGHQRGSSAGISRS